MPSLIEGYNYDIFISYRQKDNKGDHWVSEFVDALKTELESTFKEEISVYFDINSHDGLLETHDVEASLKEKLKCLIFIPIISRTYCDPRSFAWEYEFKAFVQAASNDQFGLKVKLPNGNVASRILPIKIHDPDNDDVKFFEEVTGSTIRTMDFIFRTSSGVNRPLKSREDNPGDNLNKTFYQDQINKVALAIKEIVLGIKREPGIIEKQKIKLVNDTNEVIINTEDTIIEGPRKRSVLNKITIFISVLAITLIIIGFLFIPGLLKNSGNLEKSIAVLPFKYMGDDPDKQYFADAMMDEILLHLSKIKELRVLDRTSVEQYRGTTETTVQISRELNVEYILEGSFQKFEDSVKLLVKLISARRKGYVWVNEYDKKWNEIFTVQKEVAQSIAGELNAAITPDERQIIGKIPTKDLTAYDLFIKAERYREEYRKTRDLSSYQTAVNLYTTALETDNRFARAYVGLGWAYYERYFWPEYFKENSLDSCLVLVNIALSIDDKLDEAYYLKAVYYRQNGNIKEALINLDNTIEINPNYYLAYTTKGALYSYYLSDNVKGLENYYKALTLVGTNESPPLLKTLGDIYADLGFFEKAKYYYQEAYRISKNQVDYLSSLAWFEFRSENYEEALKLCKKCLEIDSTRYINQHFYLYPPGHIDEAFEHANKLIESFKRSGTPMSYFSHRIGYTFYQMGKFKEADFYLKQQIRYSEESIKLNRPYAQNMDSHYDLSATYAFLGDKDKAYKHLEEYNKMDYFTLGRISFVENDPMYTSIRKDERFQKIVLNMKDKNKSEYNRVRKWLEEQGRL